ncbi:hypothetical protein SDC9_49159 [bioreactor metagenome]|uniref:Uncharacterized protein n=1 Tax=bioreactor metagenome TaxID=1076179 RepID=A0A644WHF8_9ZZZZ
MIAFVDQGLRYILSGNTVPLLQGCTTEHELMHAPFPVRNGEGGCKSCSHIIGIEDRMPCSRPDAFTTHPQDVDIGSQKHQKVAPEHADLPYGILVIPAIDIAAVGQFNIGLG